MLKELLGLFENRVEKGNIGDYLIQKRAKLPIAINFICSILIVVMLCIFSFYIKKSTEVLQTCLTKNIVYITDTITVRIPEHSCWICKKPLTEYPTRCCGLEYNIVNDELVAKKINP
jgi:hypothetical protein